MADVSIAKSGQIPSNMAEWAENHGVALEFIQPGKPMQNGFIERFNRTYREEVLDMYVFNTIGEVREITAAWLGDYNELRPHESLGNLTPCEFAAAAPHHPPQARQRLPYDHLSWYMNKS